MCAKNSNKVDKSIDFIIEKLEEIYTLRIFEDSDPFRVLIRTILSQTYKG